MRLLSSPVLVLFSLLAPTTTYGAWLPRSSSSRNHRQLLRPTTTTHLDSSSSEEELQDLDGKIVYQRTHYRLSPGSTVSIPNALVLEERLRFTPDPHNKGYVLPTGPRTFILRKGTTETHDNDNNISQELYRLHLGDGTAHSGPGAMDTTIATLLYLAANPELMQGNVLQVDCQSGIAGLLGCIGARFVVTQGGLPAAAPPSSSQEEVLDDEVLTVPPHADHDVLPTRLHHLTLSDSTKENLQDAYDNVRHARLSPSKVSIKDFSWSGKRIPNRHYYDKVYDTIIGSDIDFSYPSSKDLARMVANSLLPSNPVARDAAQAAADKKSSLSSSSGSSFGGMGMDMEAASPPRRDQQQQASVDPDTQEIDPMIPPTFVHVCPDDRDNVPYLRQFLEKGFRMTVDIGYIKLQKVAFAFQMLPDDAHDEDSQLEDMELIPKAEKGVAYQSLRAVHHPEYAGDGSGEYFFPLETGEYQGGSSHSPSTYLEPEAGDSPW